MGSRRTGGGSRGIWLVTVDRPADTGSGDYGRSRAAAVVAILTGLTIISAIDRQVLAVLVEDVKRALDITDVQFGLVIGPIFILTYNFCLLPLGFLLDRYNRKRLLIAAVTLWTTLTFCSAFVTSFEQLAVLRVGVAIGEAMLGPAGVSLLGDIFAKRSRAAPTAVFLTGSAVGYSGSAFFAAAALQMAGALHAGTSWLAGVEPWRLTFIGVAVPGLIAGLLMLVLGREPPRGGDAAGAGSVLETLGAHLRRAWPHYGTAALGSGLLQLIGLSIGIWGPAHFIRTYHLTAVSAGYLLGGVSVAASLAGSLALPVVMRARKTAVDATTAYFEVLAVTAIFIAPLIAFGAMATALPLCIGCFGAALFLLAFNFQLPAQIAQLHAPSHLRAKIMSGMLFVLFLIAGGIGPVLVPIVAARFGARSGGLGASLSAISLGAGGLAFLVFACRSYAVRRSQRGLAA